MREPDILHGVLVRGGKRYIINYQHAQEGTNDLQNILLQAGDRIFFPSRNSGVFYVFGEVNVQGSFPIPPNGITLLQSLAMAKGPSMTSANMESIYLIRTNEKIPQVYKLTLGEIMAHKDFPIAPGDRLFVSATGIVDFERTMRAILPVFGTTYILHQGFGVSLGY